MSERIGIVETTLGDVHLTQLVGPEHLEDRRLLQVGDNLTLDKPDCLAIAHALLSWAIGEPLPDYMRDEEVEGS